MTDKAKLEVSICITPMGDGLPKTTKGVYEFADDEDAIDQYWAMLRAIVPASEDSERKMRPKYAKGKSSKR